MEKTNIKNDGWQEFVKLCYNEKSLVRLNEILKFFLTPEEKEQVATRISLVKELLKGEKTQREIAGSLNISIAKITRGSNMLKMISEETKEHLKKILK